MLRLKSFLFEAADKKSASASNTVLGAAYETATALHIHSLTGSLKNQDPEHVKRIKDMQELNTAAMAKLKPEKRDEVIKRARDSGNAYLASLEKNHGIKAKDVHEVHHTFAGISHLVGKKVDQQGNPHDVMIKTKSGQLHGASLKYASGTLSNNPNATFDKMMTAHGMKTDTKSVWAKHEKKAGLAGMSIDQKKEVRDNPEIKTANSEAKKASALEHLKAWKSGTTAQHRKLLQTITKSTPHVPYDYVVGEKGGKAEPIHDKHIHKLIKNAKAFHAVHNGTNLVHIHDHAGNHLMTFEHRPTHGSFISTQVNAKYGTGKPKK